MKKTLEQRINRLERLLKNEACASNKCESFESELDETGARVTANRIAAQFGHMLGVSFRPSDYGKDVINSPMFGWLPVSAVDEIAEDPDARFAFHYVLGDGDYEFDVFPSDNSVNLISEDGYSVDPNGRLLSSDDASITAFPLRRWKGFDLSMVEDDDEDDFALEDEVTDEEPAEDEAEDTEECVNRRLEAKLSKLERLTFGNRRFRR